MENENSPSHCVVQIKESLSEKYYASIVDSYGEVNEIIHRYEQENSLKFATWILSKDFGNIDLYQKKHKVWWEDETLAFSGVPFSILGSKILDCNYGKDRNLCAKKRRIAVDSDNPYKYPRSLRVTKKYGCPAQIHVKEVVHFPDFWITSNTKWKREAGSKKLRLTIKDKNIRNFKRSFVVLIPLMSAHLNHPAQPSDKTTHDITPSELSRKISFEKPINYGQKCRDILDEIKTLTYLVEDNEAEDLYTNLENIRNYLVYLIRERNKETTISPDTNVDCSPERHQIVITNNGKLERKKIENDTFKESTVLVKRDLQEQHEVENLEENDTTVHLYIDTRDEDRLKSPEIPNQNAKVITLVHPNVITSTSVIQTLKEKDIVDNRQEEVQPQEFEALTNMIHVLLEETKSNST